MQDPADFRAQTADTAVSLANVAEKRIADGARGTGLARSVQELTSRGDEVAVHDRAGRLSPDQWAAVPRPAAGRHSVPRHPDAGGRLLVTAPVRADVGGATIGTVALARPTAPLDHRIAVLWTLIGAVSAGGLVAAGLVAAGPRDGRGAEAVRVPPVCRQHSGRHWAGPGHCRPAGRE